MIRLALLSLLLVSPAWGQSQCGPRAMIVERLIAKYGEAQILRAFSQSQGVVFEFWGKPDGTTWTVLTSSPDGISCIRGAGDEWLLTTPVAGKPA